MFLLHSAFQKYILAATSILAKSWSSLAWKPRLRDFAFAKDAQFLRTPTLSLWQGARGQSQGASRVAERSRTRQRRFAVSGPHGQCLAKFWENSSPPYSGFGIFRRLDFVAQDFEHDVPNERSRNLNLIVG